MSDIPKLSVITINFNNSCGLRKTVQSVISQTYRDFEYIIIDGQSSDGSVEVIESFTNIQPGVYSPFVSTINNPEPCAPCPVPITFWLSEPDDGIYQAMNKGIRQARGEYLLFLNSGDYFVNNEVLQEVFSKSHEADLILGRCNITDNGKLVFTTHPPQKLTFGFLYNNGLAHQSTFIKRELFSQYGYYREDFRYNADIEFWYRTIVLNHCSTETLGIVISEYNLEGISTKENHTEAYRREMDDIYSHPLLQLLIPDYDARNAEKQEMKALYWAKSKSLIYKTIKGLYRIACWSQKYKR